MAKWKKEAREENLSIFDFLWQKISNESNGHEEEAISYTSQDNNQLKDMEVMNLYRHYVSHYLDEYKLLETVGVEEEPDNLQIFNDYRFGRLIISDSEFRKTFVDDVLRTFLGKEMSNSFLTCFSLTFSFVLV